MNRIIIETDRLILRELRENSKEDYNSLCDILKDKETMYAYEHGFTEQECLEWFERQINRYKTYGFGLWAVILKENNKLIGQAGLTMQNIDAKYAPRPNGVPVTERSTFRYGFVATGKS